MAVSTIPATFMRQSLSVVSDLDTCKASGFYQYGGITAHKPLAYGVVVCITTKGAATDSFIFQTAFETNGNIYKRMNINNGGWSSWVLIASG